ncbi:MAG: hypothetical protein RIT14_826 [Pseudomonadota bacterium]|jgi:8-oxo-dGTP diphosphatase
MIDAAPGGFVGAKAALFHGGRVLTLLRDDIPGLPWPGWWDLPGGGREAGESPEACLLREVEEEFGLALPLARLVWRRELPSMTVPGRPSVFFAARIEAAEIAAIRFGSEGQGWQMMPVADFLAHDRAIPEMQRRVALAWGGWAD